MPAVRLSIVTLATLCVTPFVMPPATGADLQAQTLRGSKASVARSHDYAVQQGMHFYETANGIRDAVDAGRFVRLTGSADYQLVGVSFPYAHEDTRTFVERLSAQYHAKCGEPLVITSAMRPANDQPANSTELSVHPTGMAVDLRRPRGTACRNWLRKTLISLERAGVIDATEEHRPPHFHIAVYPTKYSRYVTQVASGNQDAAADADDTPIVTTQKAPRQATRGRAKNTRKVYLVQNGDTLWDLARRYSVSVRTIKSVNSLKSSRIKAGQRLVIPLAN